MKKIKYLVVAGIIFVTSVNVFLSANLLSSGKDVSFNLSQIESLARGEAGEGGTCCEDPNSQCTVGGTTVAGRCLLDAGGPCPN